MNKATLMGYLSGDRIPFSLEFLDRVLKAFAVPPAEWDRLHGLYNRIGVERRAAVPAGRYSHGVFISYRRADDPGFAGRLYDRLSAKFGEKQIFLDVDNIELGVDFERELGRVLSVCQAVIVVIGKNWLTPRLNEPGDYVRREIEQALRRNIRVIPILIDGARMPTWAELPWSIQGLASRNGRVISHARFGSDVLELVTTLEGILPKPDNPRPNLRFLE